MAPRKKLPALTPRQRKLVEDNLGLAGHVVYRQFNQVPQHSTLDAEDMFQEAVLGLCVAAPRFDHAKGKFSTYGSVWARQRVSRYIENSAFAVRIPSYRIQQLRDAERLARAQGHEYEGLDAHVWRPIMLPITGGEDGALPAAAEVDPLAEMQRREVTQQVRGLLARLPDRLHAIVAMRHGIYSGAPPASFREIRLYFGLSVSRVQQLYRQALRRMRSYAEGAEVA